LLTQKERQILSVSWSEAVKERDEYLDVWDKKSKGTDAHHIFVKGSSLINRYDIRNGVTLSRKNHVIAENEQNKEFCTFVKGYIGEVFEKLQSQKAIVGIPLEYEAMFFADFFHTKQQELEDYYKIRGFQTTPKQDMIFVLENFKNGEMFVIKNSYTMAERVSQYLDALCVKIKKIKNFLFKLKGKKIFFYVESDKKLYEPLFSIFIYELLKKEIYDVFECIY